MSTLFIRLHTARQYDCPEDILFTYSNWGERGERVGGKGRGGVGLGGWSMGCKS